MAGLADTELLRRMEREESVSTYTRMEVRFYGLPWLKHWPLNFYSSIFFETLTKVTKLKKIQEDLER